MIIKICKKIIFIFFFIITSSYSSNYYQVIATVNNYAITKLDIKNETEVLKLFNPNINAKNINEIALSNLISQQIKYQEVKKEKITLNKLLVNEYIQNILKNSKIDISSENKATVDLIKKRIDTDLKWNELIKQKFLWKININMDEINEQIKKNYQENKKKDLIEIKEKLIMREKNKKLDVFSKYYLNIKKNESLIKFIK